MSAVPKSEETVVEMAVERYKRENRRPSLTWPEVLEVVHALGYRKIAEKTDLPVFNSKERRKQKIPVVRDRRSTPAGPPEPLDGDRQATH